MSNPAVTFGCPLLPSMVGRSSFHCGPKSPSKICRPQGYYVWGVGLLISSSENASSETVWKIAEGVSSTLLWRQEAADRDFFDPSWPLRSPDSGSIPNFQTVSEGEFSEVRLTKILRRSPGAFPFPGGLG